MANPTAKTIYYLPGYDGQLATALGRAMMNRGFDVAGQETRGDVRSLPFDEQIATVCQDLKDHFWPADARVICNSFGAYFFLRSQTQMPSFLDRVLQLSPIVVECINAVARTSFSPLGQMSQKELAEAGQFSVPRDYHLHVEGDGCQSVSANVQAFGQMIGIPANLVHCGANNLARSMLLCSR